MTNKFSKKALYVATAFCTLIGTKGFATYEINIIDQVHIRIYKALELVKNIDLDFGKIVLPMDASYKTVIVKTNDTYDLSMTASALSSSLVNAAALDLDGSSGATISLNIDPPSSMPTGMKISGISYDYGNGAEVGSCSIDNCSINDSITLTPAFTNNLKVGSTLSVNNAAPIGETNIGTYLVTISY